MGLINRRRWLTVWALAALLLPVLVSACTSPASAHTVRVTVLPGVSAADEPVQIQVTGLPDDAQATVQVSSTDGAGVKWQASAVYHANADGRIDVTTSPAISGSYHGVSAMGLIWSMHPLGRAPLGAYEWSASKPLTFTATVEVKGTPAASVSFQREGSRTALTERSESLKTDGFVGEFIEPAAKTATHRPAIVVLGGSEGGLSLLLPYMLASHGYPALSVAYFGEPGLPSTLSNIPLEYFAKALSWLDRQPGVDSSTVTVLGISRGSEAAQLLGVYYPHLVHAVIASVPSDVALCSYPSCTGPAWTLHGKPLPYTKEYNDPQPTDNPAAVIPDQQIQGPVFLDCGEADHTWSSCPYAQAIISELKNHRTPWTHALYAYPGAGHDLGTLVPYEPEGPATANADITYQADQEALAQLWPHLLSFLAGPASSTSH